jgi:hypothetical protein
MKSKESLISLYKDQQGAYQVEVRDFQRATDQYYALRRIPIDTTKEIEGNFVSQENNIYFPVVNRQLNLIGDSWRVNPFKSTTPIVKVTDENVEVVNKDTYVQAVGSLVVTNFDFESDIFEFAVGTTDFTVTLGPGDGIFSLKLQDRVYNLAKRIYASAITAFGGVAPDIATINSGDSTSITIGSFSCTMFYIEGSGVFVDGDEYFSNVAGLLFVLDVATDVDPIRIVANSPLGFPVFQTKDISDGRGEWQGPDTIQHNLEPSEEYWYKARYIYSDGHKTKTSFPVYAKTTNDKRLIILRIATTQDVDGTFADIEIFRKTAAGEFAFIERIRNPKPLPDGFVQFIDDGKLDQFLLEEQQYIWTEEHRTHAVIRDRYVRANLKYKSRENDTAAFFNIKDATDEDTIPPNVVAELYTKKKFEDGLDSFHKKVDTATLPYAEATKDFKDFDFSLQDSDPASKEVGYYVRYKNIQPELKFNLSSELMSNINTPFYKDVISEFVSTQNIVDENPLSPYLFIGFRYLYKREAATGTEYFFADSFDLDPEREDTENKIEYRVQAFDYFNPGTPAGSTAPSYIIVGDTATATGRNTIKITPLVYRKINFNIWEAVIYDGLNKLAQTGQLKAVLTGYANSINRGSRRPGTEERTITVSTNFDIVGKEYAVVALEDRSLIYNVNKDGNIYSFITGNANYKVGIM